DFHKSYWNRLAQLEWKDVPCDSVFAAFNGGQGSVEFHQFTVPAIQRMDCWGATMETLTRNIPSPLLTEKEAACYLSRSCSSLRRARRNGIGPGFIRIGRSIRYLQFQLDSYILSCVSVGNVEVDRG